MKKLLALITALLVSASALAQTTPYNGGTGVRNANANTLTLTGPNTATTFTTTNIAGTLSTAAQPNVTSLGTLTSLTTSGAITAGAFFPAVKTTSSSYIDFGNNTGRNIFGILGSTATEFFTGGTAYDSVLAFAGNSGLGGFAIGVLSGARVARFSTTGLAVTGTLSASGAVTLPGLASSSAATTGTLCWTTGTGNVNVDTTTTCLLSSGKYKQNDRPLTSGLQQVMALRPVSYMLKPEFNPTGLGEQIGFFAEDVAKVDPRLVSTEDDGTPHAVRYQQLTAVLARAIQEQQVQINDLKKEVAAMRADGRNQIYTKFDLTQTIH